MEPKRKSIKEIVNDPEWQELRQSMVGMWKQRPVYNVYCLRDYLGDITDPEHPKFRRVYNYLTGSGFRIGVISHPDIDLFLAQLRGVKLLHGNKQRSIN
jgi:hypothetical protein